MELIDIEKSIIKKYRKEIWSKFIKAIEEYNLIEGNDKIAVCISGGKDSFLMAKLFQELKKHGKVKFTLEFIVMDPGYNEKNKNLIILNSEKLNIPIHIYSTPIFDVVNSSKGAPCYLCARMRRGYLYSFAQSLGCNKIALGHHFDDVIETILLNIFYGGEYKTMLPKLKSQNFKNMELIRPMYFIKEKDIKCWVNNSQLTFLNCACKFTENSSKELESKRKQMKELIDGLRKTYKNIDYNIFKSSENVNIDAIIKWRKDGKMISYLDSYGGKNE